MGNRKLMNMQELFDAVAQHMIAQWAKSESKTRGGSGSAYRGDALNEQEEHVRCPVGFLIPDEYYCPQMEGACVHGTDPRDAHARGLILAALRKNGVDIYDPETMSLLFQFQQIHDCFTPPYWPEQLRRLGKAHGLTTDAVEVAIKARTSLSW